MISDERIRELLELEARKERGVYMGQRSYQEGVIFKAMRQIATEAAEEMRERCVAEAFWDAIRNLPLESK